jgi:hypothetical protein
MAGMLGPPAAGHSACRPPAHAGRPLHAEAASVRDQLQRLCRLPRLLSWYGCRGRQRVKVRPPRHPPACVQRCGTRPPSARRPGHQAAWHHAQPALEHRCGVRALARAGAGPSSPRFRFPQRCSHVRGGGSVSDTAALCETRWGAGASTPNSAQRSQCAHIRRLTPPPLCCCRPLTSSCPRPHHHHHRRRHPRRPSWAPPPAPRPPPPARPRSPGRPCPRPAATTAPTRQSRGP